MQAKEIAALTEKLAEPILNENGFEFVDCEFVKEGPETYLRLYIDKEGGISINECELVSRALDALIPENITDKPYILEVSSPGIDRVLKRDREYEKYKGREVEVKLFKALDGVKQFEGVLKGLEGNNVVITDADGKEMSFDRKDTASVRLSVKF